MLARLTGVAPAGERRYRLPREMAHGQLPFWIVLGFLFRVVILRFRGAPGAPFEITSALAASIAAASQGGLTPPEVDSP